MANKKDLNKGAAAATAKLFSAPAPTTKKEPSSPTKKENVKAAKQVFSFRGDKDAVKAWRLYASISGIKVDDLGSLALQEYIATHPLKGLEKDLFNEKMNK